MVQGHAIMKIREPSQQDLENLPVLDITGNDWDPKHLPVEEFDMTKLGDMDLVDGDFVQRRTHAVQTYPEETIEK